MGRQTGKLAKHCGQVRFASRRLRAGIAREQLIPAIVMLTAVVVAAVTVTVMFTRPKGEPTQWECLKCGNIFENREKFAIPIDCPVSGCDGQAAMLTYRNCSNCGAKVPMYLGREIEGQMHTKYWYKQEDGNYGWSPWRSGQLSREEMDLIRETGKKCANCE